MASIEIGSLVRFRIAVLLQGTSLTIEDLAESYRQHYGERLGDPKRELARMEHLGMVRRGYSEYVSGGRTGRMRSEFVLTVGMRLALQRELHVIAARRMQLVS